MLHNLSIGELGRSLERGEVSSLELTQHFLDRTLRLNPALNALVTLTAEQALADARAADQRRAAGEKGELLGIPLIHKDIFCTDGVRTSCGSRMLDNFVAPYDATVVTRLKAAGTVMLGKANMDEFAMGSSNETSYYGPVKNPWDTAKVPGGSSGGSAAATAARLAPFATGTDTGGSIRQPAALTGVTDARCEPSSCELFSRRNSSAPPPMANSSGHSTSPVTPSAPNVNAAAGVEWLPLAMPFCTPAAAPVTAPTTPLTAAPPTAPAAAVVAAAARLTVRLTLRTAPSTTPMMTP